MKLTTHFKLSEFASRGQPPPVEFHNNLRALCKQLEILRAWLAGQPITIISGWRSYEHNEACYKKERSKGDLTSGKNSRHLKGKAADIVVRRMKPIEVYQAIEDLIELGQMQDGGLGLYSGFVHYDIGKAGRRW